MTIKQIDILFSIYDEELYNEYDHTYGDYRNANEEEFLQAEGTIEYDRSTVYDNGSRHIVLTKNPFI